MKKAIAIFFFGLILFNGFGYRWVLNRMEQEAQAELMVQLDNEEYSDEELTTIRIPLHLPYQTNWSHFERYDGEVEQNGIIYNYVKRKIENGYLVLKCIPNHPKMQLQTARDDFFRLALDLQRGNMSKKSTPVKSGSIKSNMQEWEDHRFCDAENRDDNSLLVHSPADFSFSPQSVIREQLRPPCC